MARCIYKEHVQAPGKLLCGAAFVAAGAVCISLSSLIPVFLAPLPPAIALSVVFLCIFGAGYIIGRLAYGVRIKVTIGGGIGFEQGVVLSALGTGHSGRLYIPAADITNVEDFMFDQPLVQSLFQPFALQKKLDGFVVKLPGYRGSGLRITYSHAPLYDSGQSESVIYLPTINPDSVRAAIREQTTRTL
ncbi:MAG: hypothetical protein ABJK25_02260 [Halieaceae bacterium]